MAARDVSWPPGLSAAFTDADLFYTVSKNKLFDPRIDAGGWSLEVNGLVGKSLSLTLDDLRAMPTVESAVTLGCISNGVPARAIGNARWTGVRLRDVLERAGGVDQAAVDLVWICADNYTDSIPVATALDDDTLLVWGMNGEPLPQAHGAPVRAIVPGIYGMKHAKWIEAIELIAGDHKGYWQRVGWSDTAPFMTLSRFDMPRMGDTLTPKRGDHARRHRVRRRSRHHARRGGRRHARPVAGFTALDGRRPAAGDRAGGVAAVDVSVHAGAGPAAAQRARHRRQRRRAARGAAR